jgi:hypothetical protein
MILEFQLKVMLYWHWLWFKFKRAESRKFEAESERFLPPAFQLVSKRPQFRIQREPAG